MTDDHEIVTAERRQASIGAESQFAIPKANDMAVVKIATGSCILLETHGRGVRSHFTTERAMASSCSGTP